MISSDLTVKQAQAEAEELRRHIVIRINDFEKRTGLQILVMQLGDRTHSGELMSIYTDIHIC